MYTIAVNTSKLVAQLVYNFIYGFVKIVLYLYIC